MPSFTSRRPGDTGPDASGAQPEAAAYTRNISSLVTPAAKQAPEPPASQASRHAPRVGWLRNAQHILPEIVLIVVAAYLWYRTGEFRQVPPGELGPDFWPQLLTLLIAVTAGVRAVYKVLALRRAAAAGDPAPAADAAAAPGVDEGDAEPIFRDKAAIAMALAVGYVLGVIYLGYPLATAVFLAAFLRLSGKRNWLLVAPVSIGGALLFSYVFQKIVFVALPTGVGIFDTFTVWLYQVVGIY